MQQNLLSSGGVWQKKTVWQLANHGRLKGLVSDSCFSIKFKGTKGRKPTTTSMVPEHLPYEAILHFDFDGNKIFHKFFTISVIYNS